MQYLSTRDEALRFSASQAIVQGLSREGGLFLPETIPALRPDALTALAGLSYTERAAAVMKLF